jgi:hypothetical protein
MNAEKGKKGEAPVGVLFVSADQDAPDQLAKIAHRERVSADSRRPVSRFGFAVGTGQTVGSLTTVFYCPAHSLPV